MLRTIPLSIILGIIFFLAPQAHAASLFFTPANGEVGIEKELVVDIKINSDGVGINAAQATLRFPKDLLSVKSIDKTDSAFNFWLEEPSFSNENGAITFVGGTPYGISGASIQVLHIVFTTKTAGSAPVTIVDSAITASDGSGSNVLTKTTDAVFTITPTKDQATAVVATPTAAPIVIVPPVQIIREPVITKGLPVKPTINVSLYPNETSWSNQSNTFTATWDLPLDISGVSAVVNKEPNYKGGKNEGLFDSKMFEALDDGIWYLHVQFRNNVGWGPVTHYRIAVDTKSPLTFDIASLESEASDNPAPSITFKSNDALSGLKEYWVRVDNQDWITVSAQDFSGSYRLVNQTPGTHLVTVRAIDNAENGIESSLDFEILPLPLPTFTFVKTKLFSNEVNGLLTRGTGVPSTEIIFTLRKGSATVLNQVVPVNANGGWELSSGDALLSGNYTATIQNKDSRGALSLTVTSEKIKVVGRYTNIIIALFAVLFAALITLYTFNKRRHAQIALRVQMAERDAANVFKMIENDIQKLQDAQKTPTPADDEFITAKIKKNVEKMGAYIKDEISRARK